MDNQIKLNRTTADVTHNGETVSVPHESLAAHLSNVIAVAKQTADFAGYVSFLIYKAVTDPHGKGPD